MSRFFAAVLVGVLSITSVFAAGTPEQDPVVALYRDKFTAAKTPTDMDSSKQLWDCTQASAEKDVFFRHPFLLHFEREGEIYKFYPSNYTDFLFVGGEFSAKSNHSFERTLVFRQISGSKDLALEMRISEAGIAAKLKNQQTVAELVAEKGLHPSRVNAADYAIAYGYCVAR